MVKIRWSHEHGGPAFHMGVMRTTHTAGTTHADLGRRLAFAAMRLIQDSVF